MTFQHFAHTNAWGRKFDLATKKSKVNLGSSFEQTWEIFSPWCYIPRFSLEAFLVLEKKIFKCFYHTWAWQQSWLTHHDHLYEFSIPLHQKAPHEVWRKLAQGFQRSCSKVWRDDGWMDDGQRMDDDGRQVITIAHPELCSGELKKYRT